MSRKIFTISAFLLSFSAVGKTNEVVVEISNGKLKGKSMMNWKSGEFFAFQSVPFAKPPVGKLRFKASETVENWDGILDATVTTPTCLQSEFGKVLGSEDCLYLNVYTPELQPDKLKPVMFYLHRGGLFFGSANLRNLGPQHLIAQDVVIVTTNYRVGAMGFLSLDGEESEISPNNGLKDQVLALNWVKNNIKFFGGDPNLVTIFGESSGGASVSLHLISPLSNGLFHRAIAQSGNSLCNWVFGAKNTAIKLAEKLNIQVEDKKKLVEDLREVKAEEILQAQLQLDWIFQIHAPWNGGVIIEAPSPQAYLPAHPIHLLQSKAFRHVPYLTGFANREGISMEIFIKVTNRKMDYTLQYEVPYDVSNGNREIIEQVQTELKNFYFGGNFPVEIDDVMIDLWTDIWFKFPVVEEVRFLAEENPVYLYEFSADTKLNFFKRILPDTANKKGACQIDDEGYLFKVAANPEIEPGSIEETMVERMTKLWTNFAKFGKPIPENDEYFGDLAWNPTRHDNLTYMKIGTELLPAVLTEPNIDFWDTIYKKFKTK